MPRFVEDIVNRHLNGLQGELNFSPLSELSRRFYAKDETLTALILLEGFQAAAQEVRSKIPEAHPDRIFEMKDDDLEFFVLTLEEWTVEFIEKCPDIFDEFDVALERLYDWAEPNRWSIKTFQPQ